MLMGWLGVAEPWVKAMHIIFVVFWMAGLFMLPRFLVYHQECEPGSAEIPKWIHREQRLIKIILDPSMVLVWLLGIMLMLDLAAYALTWFRLKLLLVIGLTAYHIWVSSLARALARGEQRLTGRQLRLLNEIPGVAAIFIIILVVVKPF